MSLSRTPVSLGLVDAFAPTTAELLGREVLPVRAKGARSGTRGWHWDSALDVEGVGFLAYLEPLMAESGASGSSTVDAHLARRARPPGRRPTPMSWPPSPAT